MPLGSSSAAPVITPGPRRLASEATPVAASTGFSATESVDDGITALLADEPGGQLHAGRRLAPLVFRSLKQTPDPVDGCDIEPLFAQLLRRQVALDQPAQDGVE